MTKFVIGVDEAGRGPLAGPVAVGLVMVPANYDISKSFPGLKDSKQLTEAQREDMYKNILIFSRMGELKFCVRFANASYIDKHGISKAVRRSIYSGVRALATGPKGVQILLDGLLSAPKEYSQQTIIKGDEIEPVISLASVVAKVRRDRLMKALAKKYPQYGFEVHKGYGTASHRAKLQTLGLCELHRKTYCKQLT